MLCCNASGLACCTKQPLRGKMTHRVECVCAVDLVWLVHEVADELRMDDAVQKQDERDYILSRQSHQSRDVETVATCRDKVQLVASSRDMSRQGAAHLKIDVFVDAMGRTSLCRDERCVAFSDACGAKEECVLIFLRVACVADEG